jgi:S-adenosylmethionine hydrolase
MKPFIVMQTDFNKGISTCTMEGVIASIDPQLRVFDNNHNIEPFNTYEASFSLFYIVDFWPAGTIFVSVVDPGVGTSRRASAARLKSGGVVMSPDNGSLTHMKRFTGIESVRTIDETKHRLESTRRVSIFHGRDLFACCAAKLASGIISFEEVGPLYPVDEIVEHTMIMPEARDGLVSGMLETADRRFGLISTNIPFEMFEGEGISHGDMVETLIRHRDREIFRETIPYEPSFGFVKPGENLVMIGETLRMQIARNLGNLGAELNAGTGPDWPVTFRKV